jgi:secreted trypsin-like serine protease
MRKLLLIVSLLVIVSATPALGVTYGDKDGDNHPQVGLMVALDGDGGPLWRCSGTMISKRVFLTAGHCTEAPAKRATIWFDADVESGIPDNGYPSNGDVFGDVYTHPDYYDAPWWLNDVGVVVLDSDGPGPYATLPGEDELDKYAKGPKKNKVWFTAVGYGLQKSFGNPLNWKNNSERVRMYAEPRLVQINVKGSTGRRTLLLSNNANTGGTCFGDSGGPNFLKGTLKVAAVTSFGKNGQCSGQGGVFRMDRASARDWVMGFLP